MPKTIEKRVKEEILEKLLNNPKGLSINDLAEECKASRYTIAKILQRLIGEEKIEVKQTGPAKLHYSKSDKK